MVGSVASTTFQRHRAAAVWVDGAPADVAVTVADRIDRFVPVAVDGRVWVEIGPTVKAWVRQTGLTSPQRTGGTLTALSQYLAWCHRVGIELVAEIVLTMPVIDEFTTIGMVWADQGTRATYRSDLRNVADAVGPPDALPLRQTIISRSDPEQPYTDREVAGLLAVIRGFTTPARRDNAELIAAGGLGAGLGTMDLSALCGTDIVRDGPVWVVEITWGTRRRRVAIRAEWEELLVRRSELVGERPMFRPDRTQIKAKDVSGFLDRLSFGNLPRLSPQRLRVTWVVNHLNAGVPVHVVARAAGIGETQIARYFRFLDDVAEADEFALLRRASR